MADHQNSPKKHALITGGSMGLGKAFCDQLLAEGWSVTSIDRDIDKANIAVNSIKCDLANRAQRDAMLEGLKSHSLFDLVIMNAGVSATGKFEILPVEAHEKLILLNAETPMVIASYLAKNKMMSKTSHLVFISSLSHFVGYPGAASYAASKDVIATYAKSIKQSLSKLGITVSSAFPGPLRTQHAELHSPEGAIAEKRMSPELAASLILTDVFSGKGVILPGNAAKLFSWIGKLAPSTSARLMRKVIYEKSKKEVW